jgi:hypothetical protein
MLSALAAGGRGDDALVQRSQWVVCVGVCVWQLPSPCEVCCVIAVTPGSYKNKCVCIFRNRNMVLILSSLKQSGRRTPAEGPEGRYTVLCFSSELESITCA